MALFSELRRRNVFRIGVAYLVVAWLVMQVAALAAPALRLPDWVTTFVVFVLALGFPVALVLAWAYEITPEGIRKTRDVPLEKSVSRLTGRKLDFLVIGLLAAGVVVLLLERREADGPASAMTTQGADRSIAVLPFDNLSDEPGQEHFADGLTEELLNALAAIDDLRVISRTSSFTFKGRNVPVTEIGEQLGVAHILEGSIRRAGNRIRVTAQLIETRSDSHLWSQNYDRELSVDNILQIQEDVALTVAASLRARLLPGQKAKLSTEGPSSLAALDSYHDGMYYLRLTEVGNIDFDDHSYFDLGVAAFEAAIAADPGWAPAYAGLGRMYHFWLNAGDLDEQLRKSREYLMKALALDPDYAPAYQSLAFVNTVERRFDDAFAAYDRARALGEGSHWGMAILLTQVGRYEEAAEEYRQAAGEDPLSSNVREQLVEALYRAGRYREIPAAVADYRRSNPPDPDRPLDLLAYALIRNGDVEGGLQLANERAAAFGADVIVADALAAAGERDRAQAAVRAYSGRDWWMKRATAAAILGEVDLALDVIEEAAAAESRWPVDPRQSPDLRQLAGNSRYDALLARLALPR